MKKNPGRKQARLFERRERRKPSSRHYRRPHVHSCAKIHKVEETIENEVGV